MNDKAYQPTVDNTTTPPKGYSKCTNRILNNLNELRDKAYANAIEKGFWRNNQSNEHCLMQTMVEVSEAIQANNINKRASVSLFKKSVVYYESFIPDGKFGSLFEEYMKDTVQDELADVVIMLLSFCGYRNIDIDNHIEYRKYASVNYEHLKSQTFEEFCFDLCKLITEGCITEPIYVVMAYCEHNNIDLAWHIEQKMKYNSTREYLHGKKN